MPDASSPPAPLPYRLSVLVFLRDAAGRHLLLRRRRPPNRGCWSPIGGKLEMATGESPHQCACRETGEEAGLAVTPADLHLFAMIAERSYEGSGHWLMFLFDCRVPLPGLPPPGPEGECGFFERAAIDGLELPATDRAALWPVYDRHRRGFVVLQAECDPAGPLRVTVEERIA